MKLKYLLWFTLICVITAIIGFLELVLFYNTIVMVFGFIILCTVFITYVLTLSFWEEETPKHNWSTYCATSDNRNQCSDENCTMFPICKIKIVKGGIKKNDNKL